METAGLAELLGKIKAKVTKPFTFDGFDIMCIASYKLQYIGDIL